MQMRQLLYLLGIAAVMVAVFSTVALAAPGATPSLQTDDPDTTAEQDAALAAEQNATAPAFVSASIQAVGPIYPLFMGVDDVSVPAYTMDPTTNISATAFVGAEVWGSAYDPVNDKVYFNLGPTLYEWPVGGTVNTLGPITDAGATNLSFVGLGFYDGVLYGTRNIANEAIWAIDTDTLVATVHIDYEDADFDLGGLAVDPNTGEFYATNDDATPYGAGLFRINPDGSATLITAYPAGETDIDGLAVDDEGIAYMIIDQPGSVYVYDIVAGAYLSPLINPWTSSELFSGGAYITPLNPSIVMSKTVGLAADTCATTDSLSVVAGTDVYYCYTVTNNGDVALGLHDLVDDELGTLLDDYVFDLAPGATVNTVDTGGVFSITATASVTNTAVWTAFVDSNVAASYVDTASIMVMPMFSVSVALDGEGGGTVTSTPAGINCGADCSESYNPGTVVTLEAEADDSSTFDGWSGAGCSGIGNCVLTVDAAKSVAATFGKKAYNIYLSAVFYRTTP